MAEGKDAGGLHYDSSAGGNGPPTSGKRRLIRGGGGGGGYPSGQGSRSAPGPRWGSGIDCFPTGDAFQTVEQSGGGPWLSSPGAWTECKERTMAEDIQRQECPHDDDLEIQPRTDTIRISEDGVPVWNIVSPYGGGVRSIPGATATPVPLADGPQLGPWRVAVVRVEETPAGDASGAESPCAKMDRKRPIDLPEVAGNDGSAGCWPPPPELV